MVKQVTFIHTSDLHIGAPFRGLQDLSEAWANRLLVAIPESYRRVIDLAIEHKVDFVLIAGDVFDSAHASYADYLIFFEGLNRLNGAGIKVYMCTGNHDPYTSWKQDFFAFPPNTYIFSADEPDFTVFEKEGQPLVVLGGRSYYNHTWPQDKDIAEGINAREMQTKTGTTPPFSVGVIHTGLNLDKSKAPTDPNALLRSGIDYWALGHIHMRLFVPPENPRVVFSGCIQGREINETGERGILKVTLEEEKDAVIEFIPTASVVWERLEVDVEGCITLSEVNDRIVRELFRANGMCKCEEMCSRITLTGKTDIHALLARPGILQELRQSLNEMYPMFFCDALIDKTVLPVDKRVLREEGLFPAVLLQVSSRLRKSPEESIALLQEEFAQKGFPLPSSCAKKVDNLAEEAENLVLDLLGQGNS